MKHTGTDRDVPNPAILVGDVASEYRRMRTEEADIRKSSSPAIAKSGITGSTSPLLFGFESFIILRQV